ncbi:MAG: hypothetical protein LBQ28_00135 [Prevotellaceae bacterium]|nr:hypothetical protein [Prevotellaceae bacterium]
MAPIYIHPSWERHPLNVLITFLQICCFEKLRKIQERMLNSRQNRHRLRRRGNPLGEDGVKTKFR